MGLLTELVEKGWLIGDKVKLKKSQIDQIKNDGCIVVNDGGSQYQISIKPEAKNKVNITETDLDVVRIPKPKVARGHKDMDSSL